MKEKDNKSLEDFGYLMSLIIQDSSFIEVVESSRDFVRINWNSKATKNTLGLEIFFDSGEISTYVVNGGTPDEAISILSLLGVKE